MQKYIIGRKYDLQTSYRAIQKCWIYINRIDFQALSQLCIAINEWEKAKIINAFRLAVYFQAPSHHSDVLLFRVKEGSTYEKNQYIRGWQFYCSLQVNEYRLRHSTDLESSLLLPTVAQEFHPRITMCLEHWREEIPQNKVLELNPIAELQGFEIVMFVNRRDLNLWNPRCRWHRQQISDEKRRRTLGKNVGKIRRGSEGSLWRENGVSKGGVKMACDIKKVHGAEWELRYIICSFVQRIWIGNNSTGRAEQYE